MSKLSQFQNEASQEDQRPPQECSEEIKVYNKTSVSKAGGQDASLPSFTEDGPGFLIHFLKVMYFMDAFGYQG